MKKLSKLIMTGLLLGGLILPTSGCVKPAEPFVPPEGGSDRVTINDAYDWNETEDGSNRPNLGGDYEAVVPPTAVDITIADSSTVRFKGGEKNYRMTIGTAIKPTAFEESTLNGHTVEGFAVIDEEGNIGKFTKLEEFFPLAPVTVAPYFAPESGESVSFGSSKVGDYYYDETGADLSSNPDYKIATENALVENYMGKKLTLEQPLNKDSFFRSVTVLARVPGKTYTYHYGFKNYGEEAISFTVYQMFTSYRYTNPETCVASDVITVNPGEYKTVDIKVRNTNSDGNTLTLIKLEQDIQSLDLGVTMVCEENVVKTPATITLNLPEGFKVASTYKTSVMTNDKLVLPTKEQITNETGHKLLGWVYTNSNETAAVAGSTIKGNITIEPLLTYDVKVSFAMPEGMSVKSTYETTWQSGDTFTLPTTEQINNTTRHKIVRWEYSEGGVIKNGITLTEDFTIKPVLTEDATITLELPEGFTVSNEYSTIFQTGDTLVLPTEEQITNETGHKLIRWVDGDGNPVNDKTVVYDGMKLVPELSQSATISVALPTGMTISSDYVTSAQTGDILVLPKAEQISGTIADGRELLGWYVVGNGNTILGDDYMIMDTELTIAPYFSRRTGTAVLQNFGTSDDGKPLVFCNNQGTPVPMNVYDASGNNISGGANKFDQITDRYNNTTPIGGGEGGYAELGNFIKYNGTLTAGMRFRVGTMITNNSLSTTVVALNTPHTFYYNFENLGTSAIHLTIQGVNSGTDVEGPISHIDLAPGESVCVSFTVTYKNGGANKNVMGYFTVKEDVTDMKLGVSVNVKLNDTSASTAPDTQTTRSINIPDAYLGAAVSGTKKEEA